MQTWNIRKSKEVKVPKEMEEFLEEIINIMKKYNFSISHEDSHGGFIIEIYDEHNIKWLKSAFINF